MDENNDSQTGREEAGNAAFARMFGELGCIARETLLDSTAFVTTETNAVKKRIEQLHLLDKLDFVNDESNEMDEVVRQNILRELVQELKNVLPKGFQEAYNHPDEKFRERWREAIRKELRSLVHVRKVWRTVKRSDIPKGKRCVKSKWVFFVEVVKRLAAYPFKAYPLSRLCLYI